MKFNSLSGMILAAAWFLGGASAYPKSTEKMHPFVQDGDWSAYHLTWSDEFDGPTIDPAKWLYRTDSKAQSTQQPGNVSIDHGVMKIALRQEAAQGKPYTGGGLISRKTFQFGYYEARLRIPAGPGWHTSFWMQKYDGATTKPTTSAQELDVIENDSIKPKGYSATVHKWNPAPPKILGGKWILGPDLSQDFHVFGCEFTPQVVRYFLDGKPVFTVDVSQAPHSDQNIWLTSIAVLDQQKGLIAIPGVAEFDYVRFFEKKP